MVLLKKKNMKFELIRRHILIVAKSGRPDRGAASYGSITRATSLPGICPGIWGVTSAAAFRGPGTAAVGVLRNDVFPSSSSLNQGSDSPTVSARNRNKRLLRSRAQFELGRERDEQDRALSFRVLFPCLCCPVTPRPVVSCCLPSITSDSLNSLDRTFNKKGHSLVHIFCEACNVFLPTEVEGK